LASAANLQITPLPCLAPTRYTFFMPFRVLAMRLAFCLVLLGLFGGKTVACVVSRQADNTAAPASLPPAASPAPPAPSATTDYHLSPEKYRKAIAFSRAGYRLYFLSVLWNFAIILALLRFRFFASLRDFVEAQSPRRHIQALIFVAVVFAAVAILNLPIRIYWHDLSLSYQQSVEPWAAWLWDWTKGEFLGIAFAVVIVFLLFTAIRRRPRTWWLFAWLGAIPITLFVVFISPWYIDPLFNRFEPLREKYPQLTESIVALTRAAQHPIPPDRVFLMEASAKTNAVNAYVTGLGSSTRMVIWDTAIRKSSPDELLCIVGHEMGHYVMHHVTKGVLFFLASLFFALYLAYRLLHWMTSRWGESWGIRGSSDWAGLGILLLLFNVMSFFGQPIGNAFSRAQEHAADLYGLEIVQGFIPNANEATAHSFQVLGEEDLDDPDPPKFIVFWLYTHPPLNERLRFAHNFQPSAAPVRSP
jgi:Zn-dependent protease with chaperone function